ncbi:LytR/AlgR family response regulator transcription factor [Zongyangia hominis]|uniref:Stage 0 sporulation protein A homolog n=1 Tax=Zongyangia hominis TaxID=2763677 RepID=A0A926IA60_9FIRM|nr:LytTR family DNA-binding domain-containing protein [Zongyangia hominis]MBC8569881.1 response regulator transcription factor [Zongyangia hominis]
MQIAIVDDSQMDRRYLWEFLNRYCEEQCLQAQLREFESGDEFLKESECKDYAIVFLDIYMDKLNGIETAKKLRQMGSECLLIFCTTSEHFAVESYRVRAFDYLVKPYSFARLSETMKLCDQALCRRAHYIEVKEGRTFVKIPLHSIIYTDYYNHYIQIHTKERMVRCYQRFPDFAPKLLCYPQFLCCYRNCIVNMDEVEELGEQDFVMSSGDWVPIARKLRQEVRQKYADYAFDKLEGIG